MYNLCYEMSYKEKKAHKSFCVPHPALLDWVWLQSHLSSYLAAFTSSIGAILSNVMLQSLTEYTVNRSLPPSLPRPAEVSSISLLADVSKVTWVLVFTISEQ